MTPNPILELTSHLWAATAGNAVDGQVLRYKIQSLMDAIVDIYGPQMDEDEDDGSPTIHSGEVARRLADHVQLATQTVGGKGGRMLAVRTIMDRYRGNTKNVSLICLRMFVCTYTYMHCKKYVLINSLWFWILCLRFAFFLPSIVGWRGVLP